MTDHAPTPWELIEATEHHGAYVVNSWGRTICDLYAMSNPMAASVRNGGTSFPVHFDDMAANAAFIVKAVNAHEILVKTLEGIAEYCSGDDTTLGALHRLTSIRNTALTILSRVSTPSGSGK